MKKWDEWLLIRGLLSVLNDKEVPQVIGRKQWLQTSGVWRKKALSSHRLNAKCGDKAGNSRYQRSTRRLKTNKQTKKWEIVSDWATRIRAKLLLELLLSLLREPNPKHCWVPYSLRSGAPILWGNWSGSGNREEGSALCHGDCCPKFPSCQDNA